MQRRIYLCLVCLALLTTSAHAIEKTPPNPTAIELLNRFMTALQTPDESARVRAILPLVHKSLKINDGSDLTPNVRRYSFQKASDGVRHYAVPVSITEVHKGRTVQVGYQVTAERGRKDKYFVAKKKEAVGRPAPIHVFFPDGGGAPAVGRDGRPELAPAL